MIHVLIYGMSSIRGGVESFLLNYAKHFDPQQVEVDFVIESESIPEENELMRRGCAILRISPRRSNPLKHRSDMSRIFKNKEYDVVWANVCSLSSIDILVTAKHAGVKQRIIHSHNSQNMGGKITKFLHWVNRSRLARFATDYWACSREAGEWMYQGIVDPKKITVIRNAIDSRQFEYSTEVRQSKRIELGISDDQLVVGNIGRLHEQKNQGFLLDIFAGIHQSDSRAILLIAGIGELEKHLRKKAEELGIEKNVHFLGNRTDIPALLQAMDVFVLPSKYEGLPFVLVEAQAAGLPCIASRDVISKESKITSLLEFVPLSDSIQDWVKTILRKHKDTNRQSMCLEIEAAGFDIRENSKTVAQYFQRTKEDPR